MFNKSTRNKFRLTKVLIAMRRFSVVETLVLQQKEITGLPLNSFALTGQDQK